MKFEPSSAVTKRLHRGRLAVVVAVVGLGALAAIRVRVGGPSALPLDCLFHRWTGLHCSGCGMTRACHAVLGGRIGDAFAFNPLGVLLLPPLGLALGIEAWAWVRGCPPAWRIPLGPWGAVALATAVIGFGLLRNLPWWPFTLLAPS